VRDALPIITEQYPNLRFVGFTVDPVFDTPERLREYGEEFEFDPEHWTYLTGDETEIYELAKEDFLLPVVETPEQLVASEGPFTHSTKFALINKNGFIVQVLDGMDPDFPANLQQALLRNGM
jgi:protein SCO1/2